MAKKTYVTIALSLTENADGDLDLTRHIVTIRDDDALFGIKGEEAGQAPAGTIDGEAFNAQQIRPLQSLNAYIFSTSSWETVAAFAFQREGVTYYLPNYKFDARDIGIVQYVNDNARPTEFVYGVQYAQQGLFPTATKASAGNDILAGSDGNNRIDAGKGHDYVSGLGGNDTLLGGNGYDRLCGGIGSDMLRGGKQDDTLFGNTGADTLHGEAGNDRLDGGAKADRLFGGAGKDTLIDGGGSDRLTGGAGADVFVLKQDRVTDRIMDFQDGVDRIDLDVNFRDLTIRNGANGTVEIVHGGEVLIVAAADGALQRGDFTAADFL